MRLCETALSHKRSVSAFADEVVDNQTQTFGWPRDLAVVPKSASFDVTDDPRTENLSCSLHVLFL